MKCRGLIFDLDGTLLDTLDDLAMAANATLENFGFPAHPVDAYRYFVGEGLRTLMQRIVPGSNATDEQLNEYMVKFGEIYTNTWNVNTRLYEGIFEMIASLSAAGLQLAVLSNKPHLFTQLCVETFFPEQPFAFVFGQRDGVAKKPNPAGALEIAEKMGVAVADILYVGDTATDMQTGNGAGMRTIGVEWGFRDRTELENNNAWKIVRTPAEVVTYAI
ncbi:haloacid dehalogenase superfamily enzyme, subfamily IA [Desulfocapsa sulfexigens DSM 10523]|uniref:phosphoglycolate phosphatase n=1 Tax=Desulfocapsa sulfexigens (strain DSM 10523 / SB164P1) TaxID=1167006 RepID=M1PTW5_DESSD|nr:HAD family hydrolase [Desulfocapsa sulfexigens]AGF79791.1 haloacid dehalogenase superfamily enzyme, subfamily IA [Desulfocapsa sulfexigens DSM 10523]